MLEEITTIEKLWKEYEEGSLLTEDLMNQANGLDLEAFHNTYKSCIEELLKKEKAIHRNQLVALREAQQEILLQKDSCSHLVKNYLMVLEKIGQLILDLH